MGKGVPFYLVSDAFECGWIYLLIAGSQSRLTLAWERYQNVFLKKCFFFQYFTIYSSLLVIFSINFENCTIFSVKFSLVQLSTKNNRASASEPQLARCLIGEKWNQITLASREIAENSVLFLLALKNGLLGDSRL